MRLLSIFALLSCDWISSPHLNNFLFTVQTANPVTGIYPNKNIYYFCNIVWITLIEANIFLFEVFQIQFHFSVRDTFIAVMLANRYLISPAADI